MRFSRRLFVWLVGFAALAMVSAVPASGYVVYGHIESTGPPGGIWVMHDDGSGKRELISERATGVGESLREPSVDPRGGIVLFTGHGAIWKWQQGKVANLTKELSTVVGSGQSGFAFSGNGQAQAVGDGTFVWQYTLGISAGWSEMHTTIKHARLDGKRLLADVPRTCGDVWRDASPAPRPGGGIAYVGCDRRTGLSLQDHTYDQISMYGLSPIQMVVAEAEDHTWSAPSWDPTGRLIVAVLAAPVSGSGRFSQSIWVTDVTATGGARYRQVLAPQNGQISSPRFMGEGRIVFGFSPAGTEGRSDIYSLPASCTACGLGSAKRLTSDGVSTEPAWTGSALITPREGATVPGGQRLGSALSRGLRLTVVCNRSCLAGASTTIDGSLARKLGLISRKAKLRPYQVASGALRSGSGSRTLTIKFGSRAQRALRKLKSVKLAIQVRCVTTRLTTYKLTVTLRR